MFRLSNRSAGRLEGVHPLLVSCVCLALRGYSTVDFGVASGAVRTIEQQKKYVAEGSSKTLNSKHLIQIDGFSHAVDLYPSGFGSIERITEEAWKCQKMAMVSAARSLRLVLECGYDWGWDKPHFEIKSIL